MVAAGAGLATDAGTFGATGASAAGGIDSEIATWSTYGADTVASGALGGAPTLTSAGPAMSTQSDVVGTLNGAAQPLEGSTSPVVAAAGSPDVAPTAAIDNSAIPQGDATINASSDPGRFAQQPGNPAAPSPGVAGPIANPNATAAGFDPQAGAPLGASSAPVTGTNPSIGPADYGAGGPGAGAGVTGKVATEIGAGTAGTSSGGSGIWDSLKGILDQKGTSTLLSGVIQAGSAFIAGATSTLTPAQVAALNAQAAANTATANLSQRQLSNMGQPLPVASRTPPPVTGAPTGLINSPPPPPRVPVTGAPA